MAGHLTGRDLEKGTKISLRRFLGRATPPDADEPFQVMMQWPGRAEIPRDPLEQLRGYDSKLVYFLSLFPGEWAASLVEIRRTLGGTLYFGPKIREVRRQAEAAVREHTEHCRWMLGELRGRPDIIVREGVPMQHRLLRAAARTDYLSSSYRVPFDDDVLICEMLRYHLAFPYSPNTAITLIMALMGWRGPTPPKGNWPDLPGWLGARDQPNLVDTALAVGAARTLCLREPGLSKDLLGWARSSYSELSPWLDLEAEVFRDLDYSHLPSLDTSLEPLIADALRELDRPLWPDLCTRAAHALPNLGDRSLNTTLERALTSRIVNAGKS